MEYKKVIWNNQSENDLGILYTKQKYAENVQASDEIYLT